MNKEKIHTKDRAFYGKGKMFKVKVYSSVVSCWRGSATAAFDQINKYALITICT